MFKECCCRRQVKLFHVGLLGRAFSGVLVWCSLVIAAVAKIVVNASRLRTMGVKLMPHGV